MLYSLSSLIIIISATLLWANSSYNLQSDWTQGKRNTLNIASIELLERMDKPIIIQAYFDSSSQTREQVRRFVDRYQRFKNDIKFEFIDNLLATDEIEKLGFTHLGQLKITYDDKDIILNRLNEERFTGALFKLARQSEAWVVVLQGHGERDPFATDNNGLSKLTNELNNVGINVQPLNLLAHSFIPDNTTLLVIAGPRSAYLEAEISMIGDYLQQGGNLLYLRDPSQDNFLEKLDEILAIETIPGVVIDANTRLRIMLGIKHAAVIPVPEFKQHDITSSLKSHGLFPFTSGLSINENSDWQTDILFTSLPRSWSEVGGLSEDELSFQSDSGDTTGPLSLGLALSRMHNDHLQRVVVIADSDFVANGYIGYGANFPLSLNIFNWLTEDDSLIAISHHAVPDQHLELRDKDIITIALILLIIIPAVLVATGFCLHWLRNKN